MTETMTESKVCQRADTSQDGFNVGSPASQIAIPVSRIIVVKVISILRLRHVVR